MPDYIFQYKTPRRLSQTAYLRLPSTPLAHTVQHGFAPITFLRYHQRYEPGESEPEAVELDDINIESTCDKTEWVDAIIQIKKAFIVFHSSDDGKWLQFEAEAASTAGHPMVIETAEGLLHPLQEVSTTLNTSSWDQLVVSFLERPMGFAAREFWDTSK